MGKILLFITMFTLIYSCSKEGKLNDKLDELVLSNEDVNLIEAKLLFEGAWDSIYILSSYSTKPICLNVGNDLRNTFDIVPEGKRRVLMIKDGSIKDSYDFNSYRIRIDSDTTICSKVFSTDTLNVLRRSYSDNFVYYIYCKQSCCEIMNTTNHIPN